MAECIICLDKVVGGKSLNCKGHQHSTCELCFSNVS
jgi:hypothetical protein